MALYQPTNVYPSILNGDAEGTVDGGDDLTISWQINGPSKMESFGITIKYITNGSSITVYSRSGLTDGCPAYGKDNLGNVVPFSFTIPNADLVSSSSGSVPVYGSGIIGDYSISITQEWADGMKTYQNVAAFRTYPKPVFEAESHTNRIRQKTHTFDFLTFSDESLQWFRWQMFLNEGEDSAPVAGKLIYDTGKVYGSGDMTMTYDGFDDKIENICVQCTACSKYGIEVTSDLYEFYVDYGTDSLTFPTKVSALSTGSAIQVDWLGTTYIPGESTGGYSLKNGILTLDEDGEVSWSTVNESPMSFAKPWIFIAKTKLSKADCTLFKLGTDQRYISVDYDLNGRRLTFANSDLTTILQRINYTSTVTIIIACDSSGALQYWVRYDFVTGGLYPHNVLYPNTSIYPRGDSSRTYMTRTGTLGGTFTDAISRIRISGNQISYFMQLFNYSETLLNTLVELGYKQGTYTGESSLINDVAYFRTAYDKGLSAGTFIGYDGLVGWEIYRAEPDGENYLKPLATVPVNSMYIRDYTARTDGTKYTYEIAPVVEETVGSTTYTKIGTGIKTDMPFGIIGWYYSLIECEYEEEMECYHFISEYLFGYNVKTGSISNNNSANVLENFTQYPTVQLSPHNYKTGSLEGLIGTVRKTDDGNIVYSDSRELRDAIFALPTSKNDFFLKTRKGDIFKVRISNDITMDTMDETKEQALSASISWVEIDDASDDYIIDYGV